VALFDLQAFLQERGQVFDENLDVSAGSPFDTQVIQPTLRRLGTDPFTVDLAVFLSDRLKQAFPEMATDEGDALTDLLIKPAVLLWDPFVREVLRIRSGQSFRDPTSLTTEEAEALGANLFSDRATGEFTRGQARVYFSQPRAATLNPMNFFTTKSGLHFFPDGTQAITVDEMLLNQEGSLYYFDVNVIAQEQGTAYNIGPNELVNVANLDGTQKVTNLRRYQNGEDAETAADFVSRTEQELTERSMVTLRGIGAKVPRAFPAVTRLAVVGFGDPEMQRDVIRGGGLGVPLAGGIKGTTLLDGEGKLFTRRFQALDAGVDFTALVVGPPSGYVLTTFSAFNGPPIVRDLRLRAVISADTIELESQEFLPFYVDRAWSLRKQELTLSGIPGGILYPDSAEGTVTIPDNEIHIGGLYDLSIRGSDFEESSLVIENITDAQPAASGLKANMVFATVGEITLLDLVLGTTYAVGDATYNALVSARQFGFTLQILDGPNAGDYRVVDVAQAIGSSPEIYLDTAIPVVTGDYRWRLVDVIDVDLIDPRDTRIVGSDLQSVQNQKNLTTATGVDFIALGTSVGDTLRLFDGADKGDFTVTAVPFFNTVTVDRALTATRSSLNYEIFKKNTAGGLQLPLVRITKVELLDNSSQPVGSIVPYARPIDVQSRAFENPGRGVKVDVTDGVLGIVSQPAPGGIFPLSSLTLVIEFLSNLTGYPAVTVNFSPGGKTPAQVVDEINAAASATLSANTVLAVLVGVGRVGIVPIDPLTVVRSGSAMSGFFGDTQVHTSSDVRASVDWSLVSPAINQDDLDLVQVLDGVQIGFYGDLRFGPLSPPALLSPPGADSYAGLYSGNGALGMYAQFAPEEARHVQVGSRSIGSVRCYFLEPTSIEFNRNSFFSATLSDGAAVRFFPDPTLNAVRIPAAPSTVRPKDGASTGGVTLFASASQDFVLSGVVRGDLLLIKYVPILATVVLADPVTNLALKTIVLSIDGGADQVIMFSTDLTGFPTDVSRDGVVSQINAATGRTIAQLGSTDKLELEGDVSIVVRKSGTANTLLGFSTTQDSNNSSPHAGTYVIASATQTTLTVAPMFAAVGAFTRESYEIQRPGTQRINSTQMNQNVGEAGLYHFDVELVSEGTGDQYNIDSAQQLFATGYRSDGYYLTTDDTNLTFSPVERPRLHLSRSILEVGVSDDPRNATQLSGQNLEVTYERSTLVSDVQNFASSDTERVVCANPLARHLVPHYVRFDLEYVGGSRDSVISDDITAYIKGLYPADYLESSDLVEIAYKRGASSVKSPIDLIAVVHQYDRQVQVQRSQNSLNTGRLAAFAPDRITVNRRSS
jgi:Baseplate J-like protein